MLMAILEIFEKKSKKNTGRRTQYTECGATRCIFGSDKGLVSSKRRKSGYQGTLPSTIVPVLQGILDPESRICVHWCLFVAEFWTGQQDDRFYSGSFVVNLRNKANCQERIARRPSVCVKMGKKVLWLPGQ